MSHEFRKNSGRTLCLLAVVSLLAAGAPGCGDGPKKQEGGAVGIPASVQESNKNMENFMKSQTAKKK